MRFVIPQCYERRRPIHRAWMRLQAPLSRQAGWPEVWFEKRQCSASRLSGKRTPDMGLRCKHAGPDPMRLFDPMRLCWLPGTHRGAVPTVTQAKPAIARSIVWVSCRGPGSGLHGFGAVHSRQMRVVCSAARGSPVRPQRAPSGSSRKWLQCRQMPKARWPLMPCRPDSSRRSVASSACASSGSPLNACSSRSAQLSSSTVAPAGVSRRCTLAVRGVRLLGEQALAFEHGERLRHRPRVMPKYSAMAIGRSL